MKHVNEVALKLLLRRAAVDSQIRQGRRTQQKGAPRRQQKVTLPKLVCLRNKSDNA